MRYSMGIRDDQFCRGSVPMTKQEVRVVALAKAQIRPADVIIDVGAGTGSFSVEAALLAPQGRVFAVERNPEAVALIRKNARKFAAGNIDVRLGEAPGALAGLPPADVIFVGGSGGQLGAILAAGYALLRVGGRLVVNAVTVETLVAAVDQLRQYDLAEWEAVGLQVTRLECIGRSHLFRAQNPVYIIKGVKRAGEEKHDR